MALTTPIAYLTGHTVRFRAQAAGKQVAFYPSITHVSKKEIITLLLRNQINLRNTERVCSLNHPGGMPRGAAVPQT